MATDKPNEQPETGCCPRFNPEPWDEQEVTWSGKLFVKDHVMSFLHIPLNFGRVMTRNMARIKDADSAAPEPVVLSDEKSLWGTDVYIEVSREVPDAHMEQISGTFLTKVFEGPYRNMGRWVKDMKGFVASRDKETGKLYFYYTTCPKCAKVYGKNYVVLVAQV